MSKVKINMNIGQIVHGITATTEEVCNELAKQIVNEAKTTTEFSDDTGNLRDHFFKEKMKPSEGIGYWAGNNANHAHLIEDGHLVVARGKSGKSNRGGAPISKDGKLSFVPARPFLRPALDLADTQENIIATAREVFKKRGY